MPATDRSDSPDLAQVLGPEQAVTPAMLYGDILEHRPLFILDVRNEEDVARWPIEGHRIDTLNIPYYEFLEDEDTSVTRLPTNREMIVVCAKGGASDYVAEILRGRGMRAHNLEGGMIALGGYYDTREIVSEPYGRIVQVSRLARGDLSFVLISGGEALIVDPLRHIEHYLRVVEDAGARISLIFDTHAHADHISGGLALARETGAPYYLHPYDAIHPMDMLPARFGFESLADGQRHRLGQFEIEVVWFPGHTLGQVNFLATAPSGQSFLWSGDGVFLHSFGRPDLGGKGETWAPILYDSLFEVLPRRVPEEALLMPAHFGMFTEARPGGRFAAPLSEVRRLNEWLSPQPKEAFVEYMLHHLPVFPPQYVQIKRVNLGLVEPDETEATELELGKNICALESTQSTIL
ncbi:MAG TPA: MBL fold metallo-hydrolase [Chloroflexia bacterium]|nr:MBL fold metallo-hydrolase [Chloroflexia bacterium]